MAKPLIDDETIRRYDEDGATVVRGLVDPGWQERLAEAIERDIEAPGPFVHAYAAEDGSGRFHGNLRTWETEPVFREFCLDSHLPELAARVLRSDKVNLHYDQLFVKEPGTPNRTRWHNDQPYWPVRGWQVVSFWIALDPTTADNGALEFVRGSHRWDKWYQPERFGKTSHQPYERNPDYVTMPDIESDRAAYDIVSWDLEPGDAYLFHALTVHGAGGNHRSDVRRRGYAVRYTGDDAVYDTRPGTNEANRSEDHRGGDLLDSDRFPVCWPR